MQHAYTLVLIPTCLNCEYGLNGFKTHLTKQFLVRYGLELSCYRIAGKFGGDFNLALWRIVRTPPNLNPR